MANMNDRIQKIKDYFLGMNITRGGGGSYYIYVETAFPSQWSVSKDIAERFNLKIIPNEQKTGYYFFGDMSVGYDTIFDAIEENIKLNQDAEARARLFTKKQDELRKLFEDMSIDVDTLSTLEFKIKTPRKTEIIKALTEENKKNEKKEEIKNE